MEESDSNLRYNLVLLPFDFDLKSFTTASDQIKIDKEQRVDDYLKKNDGLDKTAFIGYTLRQINIILDQIQHYPYARLKHNELFKYKQLLLKWLDNSFLDPFASMDQHRAKSGKKSKKSKHGEVTLSVKEGYPDDHVKSNLTQTEISMLFHMLKQQGIIHKDIEDNLFSDLLYLLTGYGRSGYYQFLTGSDQEQKIKEVQIDKVVTFLKQNIFALEKFK